MLLANPGGVRAAMDAELHRAALESAFQTPLDGLAVTGRDVTPVLLAEFSASPRSLSVAC